MVNNVVRGLPTALQLEVKLQNSVLQVASSLLRTSYSRVQRKQQTRIKCSEKKRKLSSIALRLWQITLNVVLLNSCCNFIWCFQHKRSTTFSCLALDDIRTGKSLSFYWNLQVAGLQCPGYQYLEPRLQGLHSLNLKKTVWPRQILFGQYLTVEQLSVPIRLNKMQKKPNLLITKPSSSNLIIGFAETFEHTSIG